MCFTFLFILSFLALHLSIAIIDYKIFFSRAEKFNSLEKKFNKFCIFLLISNISKFFCLSCYLQTKVIIIESDGDVGVCVLSWVTKFEYGRFERLKVFAVWKGRTLPPLVDVKFVEHQVDLNL